jgi:hypothetical protein
MDDLQNLPYQPLRARLYNRFELFQGFLERDPGSFVRTPDFLTFRHYVATGRGLRASYFESMMQSLHDNSVARALLPLLRESRTVAVMGGHKLGRDSAAYRDVARLARKLAASGYLLASGGGPGAMEATHLGAAFARQPEASLRRALARLARCPTLPDSSRLVSLDGAVDDRVAEDVHAWFTPAWAVAKQLSDEATSVAIPTWHYGHEPTTPLASHIAKLFKNSIREDGLLAIAAYGVVFTEGRAGTIQEIFQDAAQNYYESYDWFSPMVLLGVDYWTRRHPVVPVLQSLFPAEDFRTKVLVTDHVEEAVAFIQAFEPRKPPPVLPRPRVAAAPRRRRR